MSEWGIVDTKHGRVPTCAAAYWRHMCTVLGPRHCDQRREGTHTLDATRRAPHREFAAQANGRDDCPREDGEVDHEPLVGEGGRAAEHVGVIGLEVVPQLVERAVAVAIVGAWVIEALTWRLHVAPLDTASEREAAGF